MEGGGVWEEEFGFVFGGEEEVGVGGLFEVCEGQERGVGLVWFRSRSVGGECK